MGEKIQEKIRDGVKDLLGMSPSPSKWKSSYLAMLSELAEEQWQLAQPSDKPRFDRIVQDCQVAQCFSLRDCSKSFQCPHCKHEKYILLKPSCDAGKTIESDVCLSWSV